MADLMVGGWGVGRRGDMWYLSSGIVEYGSEEAKSYSLSQGGLSSPTYADGGWGLLGKALTTACTVVLY